MSRTIAIFQLTKVNMVSRSCWHTLIIFRCRNEKLLQVREILLNVCSLQEIQEFATHIITLVHHHVQKVSDNLLLCVVSMVKVVVITLGDDFILLDILQDEAGVSRQGIDEGDFLFEHSLHGCKTELDSMFE